MVDGPDVNPPSVEIERVYLLKTTPPIPEGAEMLVIEQGYLPEPDAASAGAGPISEGRIRRVTRPDGTVVCTHTVKHGVGLVRLEHERSISPEAFDEQWPRTAGRRLLKKRHVIAEGDLIWELDVFESLDLAMAEVELPSADTPVTVPDWLRPHVEREVTHDPAYRNYNLAIRARAPD